MNDKQDERVEKAVKDRLMSTMDKNSFYDYIDKSFKDGGVGLNSKTAKAISEELELILILGFGVVGVSEKMAAMSREERDAERAKHEGLQSPVNPLEKIAEELKSDQNSKEPTEDKTSPSPGDIINQMKDQLNQEVKTVDDDPLKAGQNKTVDNTSKDDKKKDKSIVEEEIIQTENLESEINKNN